MNKEIQELVKKIPNEYIKIVKKIMKLSYKEGVVDSLELINQIRNIPPEDIKSYGIFHENETDGG